MTENAPGESPREHDYERAADPADRPLEPRSSGEPLHEDDSDRASGVPGEGQDDER